MTTNNESKPREPSWLDDIAASGKSPGKSVSGNADIPGNTRPNLEVVVSQGKNIPQSENFAGKLVRSLAALTGQETASMQAEWRAGSMTVGQICDVWRVDRRELLVAAARWGARAVREEYRARLASGLVDPEGAMGAAHAAAGVDRLPRDSSAAVDRAVARAVEVVREHRGDIGEVRALTQALVRELAAATIDPEELSAWCAIAAEVRVGLRSRSDGAETGAKLTPALAGRFQGVLATFERLVSLPSRAVSVEKLTSALARCVALERQAFQIADGDAKTDADHVPLEERLRRYVESGGIDAPKQAA